MDFTRGCCIACALTAAGAHAQAPGQLFCASSGNGSSTHLAMEMFKATAKADLVHVPHNGRAPKFPAARPSSLPRT